MLLWVGNLGDGPVPRLPHIHERFPKNGCSNMASSGCHSFQAQHLTLKLGSKAQRGCTIERPKGKLMSERKEDWH